MIELVKGALKQLLYDIDSGNSNISEEDLLKVIDFIQDIRRKDLSKIESANYIGVSRATFDNYVKNGLIPKGNKRQGFNELSWSKRDLDKYLLNKNKKSKF